LGCCLYSLAFFQNCFEEGSNLAILSRNYKIPADNPYGDGLVELIDRMLTVDYKARADMTEVILCLSAIYSGRPLPARKKTAKLQKSESAKAAEEKRVGTFRTDGQGIRKTMNEPTIKPSKEAKKLNPNSAAARRRRAVQNAGDQQISSVASDTSGSPVKAALSSASSRDGSDANSKAFNAFSDSFLGVEKKGVPFEVGGAFGNLRVSDEVAPPAGKSVGAFSRNDTALFSAFENSEASWPEKEDRYACPSVVDDGFAAGEVAFPNFGGSQDGPLSPASHPCSMMAEMLENNMNQFGTMDDDQLHDRYEEKPLTERGSPDNPNENLVGGETKKKTGFRGFLGRKK